MNKIRLFKTHEMIKGTLKNIKKQIPDTELLQTTNLSIQIIDLIILIVWNQ